MSSILEALRELEGDRPPATRREIPAPEPTHDARKALGAFIPILGGIAVGMVAFALWAWGPNLLPTASPPTPTPAAPVADAASPIDAPTDRPAWLDTAEAPRARVGRTSPTPPPPADRAALAERSAPPARRATASNDEGAARPADAEPRPAASGGQVSIESVAYSANAGERVATIRYHGRRVTLRQRETIGDIEVQLIMPNGVYVQRGGEVFLLPVSR